MSKELKTTDDLNKKLKKILSSQLTHGDLCVLAKRWLLSAKGCNPVFVERGSSKSNEMPDAIGWSATGSIVVECKRTVADYKADRKKMFRVDDGSGMGSQRFYLFTSELWDQLRDGFESESSGWGVVVLSYSNTTKVINQHLAQAWE